MPRNSLHRGISDFNLVRRSIIAKNYKILREVVGALKKLRLLFTFSNKTGKVIRDRIRLFQLTGSRRKTLEAAVRFSPTPPAFSDSNMTVGESGPRSSNNSITSARFLWVILPSSRTKLKPSAFSGVSTMFSIDVNCEMIRLFADGSSLLSLVKRDINVSTWKTKRPASSHCKTTSAQGILAQ